MLSLNSLSVNVKQNASKFKVRHTHTKSSLYRLVLSNDHLSVCPKSDISNI